MSWLSSGRITNPTLDQVLLDTGALPAGVYFFAAYGAGSVASVFEVQHRDATNTVTLKSQIIAAAASSIAPKFEVSERTPLTLAANERIRIIAVAAIVGAVSVSLLINT